MLHTGVKSRGFDSLKLIVQVARGNSEGYELIITEGGSWWVGGAMKGGGYERNDYEDWISSSNQWPCIEI